MIIEEIVRLETSDDIPVISSRDIAKKFEKEHKHVLEAIRTLINKNPELASYFISSHYKSKQNKIYPEYLATSTGYKIIENKFIYNVRSARYEYKLINEITDALEQLHIKYIKQYKILMYRVDLYLPDYNLVVEFDELEHKFKRQQDYARQNKIENNIHCSFLRIHEDDTLGRAVGLVLKSIVDNVA